VPVTVNESVNDPVELLSSISKYVNLKDAPNVRNESPPPVD
tara:strand:- start:13 stop:135 length:123 start_codon:yes stop_codon:yes gene_type:complete